MRKLVGLGSAIILTAAAIYDVAKESRELLAFGTVIILLIFGVVMWWLLSRLNTNRFNSQPINLALWSHSLLEGLLAAAGFAIGFRHGLIVLAALLVHLIPRPWW